MVLNGNRTNTLTPEVKLNAEHTVREFWPGVYGGILGDGYGLLPVQDIIPAWGTLDCDYQLRILDRTAQNTLWQGASTLFIQNILSTPYELSGGRNLTFKWQDIFFESDFGEGYDYLLEKFLTDYLTLNRGAFLEKVGYGEPDTALPDGARVVGLNHLDALRIRYTGNLEWPYIYYSEITNKMHKLHRTRVIRMVDRPSPDALRFGMGMSALYRVLSVANAQILLGKHQNEMLNDLPPPGLITFSNIKGEDVANAMYQFEQMRQRDGQRVYRAPMRLEGRDPSQPVTVQFVQLSQVPEGFNYDEYMRNHVNLLALGLQVDPQDIWPLSGAALGTGTQSRILSQKTQSKGYGYVLTKLERMWNTGVLPRPIELKYKAQNAEQDKETAEIAQQWTDIINSASFMTDEQKAQLAANQIPAFADVLLDEQGNLRLPDDDPKADQQAVVATDAVEIETGDGEPVDETTADDMTELKDYPETRDAYTGDVETLFTEAVAGNMTKTTFGVRMRSILNRYGKAAYLDGLESGGVELDALDTDGAQTVAGLLASQSEFVTNASNELFSTETGLRGSPEVRAPMWSKSLQLFYDAGLLDADANGLYVWHYGDTDHCDDCRRLNGQKHRLKDWHKEGWLPQSSNLRCKGFNCKCSLTKTTGKPRGGY